MTKRAYGVFIPSLSDDKRIEHAIRIIKPIPKTLKALYAMFCDLYPRLAENVTGWKSAGFKSDDRAIELELFHGPTVTFNIFKEFDGNWYFEPYVRLRNSARVDDMPKLYARNYKDISVSFMKVYPEFNGDFGYVGYEWGKRDRAIEVFTPWGNSILFNLTKDQNGEWKSLFVDYILIDQNFLDGIGYFEKEPCNVAYSREKHLSK